MDLRQVSKEFLIEFLDLYKEQECLWKINSKDYSDRNKKQEAYNILLQKYSEVDRNANRDLIVKKIDSMRGCFRKELKKIKMSKESGDTYTPKLWYFEKLLFLVGQEVPKKSFSNLCEDLAENDISENENESAQMDVMSLCTQILEEVPPTQSSVCTQTLEEIPFSQSSGQLIGTSSRLDSTNVSASYFSNGRKKRYLGCNSDLEKVVQKCNFQKEDEFDLVGKNIACKLRQLPKETKIITEKFLMDIIYQAELGCIERTTKLILENVTASNNAPSFSQYSSTVNSLTNDSTFCNASHKTGDSDSILLT